jgi:hypothetical protein
LILDMSDGRRVPWRIRADVARAGAGERLRAAGLGGDSPDARVRGGTSLVLWAWAVFVIAGAIVQRFSEHWDQALPAGHHTAATVAFGALIAVAVATSLVVLAGIALTLPTLVRFLGDGGWPHVHRHVRRAALMTVALLGATAGLAAWAHGLTVRDRNGSDGLYEAGFLVWAALAAGTLFTWTSAASRTAARLHLPSSTLRIEGRLAAVVALAMVVMTAATAVWWVAVGAISPGALTGSSDAHATALVPQLVVAMALMLAAAGLGAAGARRASGGLAALPHDG